MVRQRHPLTPARIDFAGGVPFAVAYDDVYHSADGGPAQTRHVFLAGNGLPERWRGRPRFAIVETGFGLGLNFLCTAEALRTDPSAPMRLHYVAVEKHPPDMRDLERAHRNWPQLGEAAELRRVWPLLIPGFHRLELLDGRVSLTLAFGDAADMLSEIDSGCVDALYLDGFAPEKNPGMWSQAVFRELARVARPGATAATWSVAKGVRAGLHAAGFRVEKRPGFARKREMLTASLPVAEESRPLAAEHHAVVVGAGIAGCWTAHRLARRGWSVHLIERRTRLAQEASGNAVAALLPALNLADNENARLARAAFLWATHLLAQEASEACVWALTGVLQLALSAQQAERMPRILQMHGFPPAYAAWIEQGEASARAERPVGGPGWWIPRGGWVAPERLCRTLLEGVHEHVRIDFGREAFRVVRDRDRWLVLDRANTTLAAAPVVVLANGLSASTLGIAGVPPLVSVRGQVTHLPPDPTRSLRIVVCGDGYVAPLPQGGHCVGATFEPDSTALETRRDDHAENLARAERMLPGFAAALAPAQLGGWVGLRAATPDRLPLCGPLSYPPAETEPGLHLLAGLGSRGIIWAPLCAELLAARLDGEPNPVEASLVAALAPSRFTKLSTAGDRPHCG